MASAKQHYYPDHLNPFGSDDEDQSGESHTKLTSNSKHEEYPDFLSPFGNDDNDLEGSSKAADDYDDSLNPFGEEQDDRVEEKVQENTIGLGANECDNVSDHGEGNPFEDCETVTITDQDMSLDVKPIITENVPSKSTSPQPESLEPPPVPLPRTKSLLKKEQAQKNKQLQLLKDLNDVEPTTLDSSGKSVVTTDASTNPGQSDSTSTTFQKKKNKRNAPPVPINFKRQVSGSLHAIEEELNEIGDELAILEKESSQCQQNLEVTNQVDESQFSEHRIKFIELIKRKNSIVRRQKELMYRKRELKLDQIHSDIEYELRMIGNKQLSHRTPEDDIREKELLKKLVEIVEEKSDIVENLNKDSSCDSQDIEEAFRRLRLTNDPPDKPNNKDAINSSGVSNKNEICDKSSATMGVKLSKIATLLPRGGTLKGTIKIKRKRLFKKV